MLNRIYQFIINIIQINSHSYQSLFPISSLNHSTTNWLANWSPVTMDPNDDEAPKDPGSTRQYTEKDFEGN